MKLVVQVDPRRDIDGTLRLYGANDRIPLGPVPVCATADASLARRQNNAICDPLRPGGHPPFGTYRLVSVEAVDAADRRERGPQALSFEPAAGDALRAESFGRLLLDLHGGAPGRRGELRATGGGLRVADPVIEELAARLAGAEACELQLQSVKESWWSRLFRRRRRMSEVDDTFDRDVSRGSSDSGSSEPAFSGRGGEFSGAGASGSWDSASSPRAAASNSAATGAGAAIVAGAVLAASASGGSDKSEPTGESPAIESSAVDAETVSGTTTETSY